MSNSRYTESAELRQHVVAVTDRYTTESLAHLRQRLECEVITTPLHQLTDKEKSRLTALLIRSRTKVDRDLLNSLPNLQAIVTATSGYDHIDLEATKEKHIATMFTPDANTESAAELTLMMMLGVLRRVTEVGRLLRDGRWRDELSTGLELKNKTVGIVGLGRVGSRVAELLQTFKSHVIAHDPYQSDERFLKLDIERQSLVEVFAQADILSFHVPLNAETRRMIRAETLELTKEGVILINTSRGQVIDEGALVSGLDSGQIWGAGLDVFEHEPLARDSRLRRMKQVVLTPHIGAYTDEAYAQASFQAVQSLVHFIKTGEIIDNLPPQ